MQRPKRHRGNRRGAIWVRNQLCGFGQMAIDFRHDQRNIVIQTECRGIINHQRTFGNFRPIFLGKITRNSKKDNVTLFGFFDRKQRDGLGAELSLHGLACGTLGREQGEFTYREVTIKHNVDQLDANRTGCADYTDMEIFGTHNNCLTSYKNCCHIRPPRSIAGRAL